MPKRSNDPMAKAGTMGEIGVTGLRQYGGRIDEEFHKNLSGDRALEVYNEMMHNSPTVRGVLFAIEMLMRQVKWRVDPAQEEASEDVEAVEFVDQCRNDMSFTWEDTIAEILSMLGFGWSYHEIVYKRRAGSDPLRPGNHSQFDDGQIGWRKLPIRAQQTRLRWEIDKEGGIGGMWQQDMFSGQRPVLIPIQKALLFRANMHKNNPEGLSVLRAAYRPYHYVTRLEETEAIGVERDLTGYPVGYIPGEHIKEQSTTYTNWTKSIRNIRNNEQKGLVIPSDRDPESGELLYDVKLLTTPGQRTLDTDPIIQRYEKRIAMTMLADFLFLGQDKVGSFALSGNKMSLFGIACSAWADAIAAVFNRHAVPRLLALNGYPLESLPKLSHEPIEVLDLTALAEVISKLTAAGMPIFPDPKLENVLRGLMDLPEMTEQEMADREVEDEAAKELEAEMQRSAFAQGEADRKTVEAGGKPKAVTEEPTEKRDAPIMAGDTHNTFNLPPITVEKPDMAPLAAAVVEGLSKVQAPVIHVAPATMTGPTVHVAAPNVTVGSPNVTVRPQMPPQAAPQITNVVNVPEQQDAEIEVVRNEDGLITKLWKRFLKRAR